MPGFRRSPGSDHLVHAVELPELQQRRARRAQRESERAAAAPVSPLPLARALFRQRPQPAASRGPAPSVPAQSIPAPAELALTPQPPPQPLREVEVPRPAAAPADDRRIELLERRLAKLAKLLEERDEQMRTRMARAQSEPGVASIYSEVQGLQGQSEEVERKRAMMSAIYEANRKLRERVGSERRDAE